MQGKRLPAGISHPFRLYIVGEVFRWKGGFTVLVTHRHPAAAPAERLEALEALYRACVRCLTQPSGTQYWEENRGRR